MKLKTFLKVSIVIDLKATILCAFLSAVAVYVWTDSVLWGFVAYSLSGTVYLILYMVLSAEKDESPPKKTRREVFTTKKNQ